MKLSFKELELMRREWVNANRKNGFDEGIKRLLTDLYPDNAHFVYELLQNAEDARAQEVRFILLEDRIEFEHNGDKLFTMQDVDAITSIGFSTKRDDVTSIGKFGVGFKAVFAYTDTPKINSGEYCFEIQDLVVPIQLSMPKKSKSGMETRVTLPFNNPKKKSDQALREIEKLLKGLDASTLLFLTHIRKIEYHLPNSSLGTIERLELFENRFEIRVQHPNSLGTTSAWFLKFSETVEVTDQEISDSNRKNISCSIAVAFGLSQVLSKGEVKKRNESDSVSSSEWQITPMNPGRVCIYFPADKETSNLRFHIHAPFASTVARDSVRDCAGNGALRDHIASLLAKSMHSIREQNLLNILSLATLPNEKDLLGDFYKPLRAKLVEEFKKKKLVPMKRGGHAAAIGKFRGSKNLSDLIDDDDLVTLLGKGNVSPMWVANPSQLSQREDNFLSMLDLNQWSTEALIENLRKIDTIKLNNWLANKDHEWHRKLYELLSEYIHANQRQYGNYNSIRDVIKLLPIVRVSNGMYLKGVECYFPSSDVESDTRFPRVEKWTYLSGNTTNKKIYDFFEAIGVRVVDEKVEAEAILREHYTESSSNCGPSSPNIMHVVQFAKLVQNHRDCIPMFKKYKIFKLRNGKWGKPDEVYLDEPYFNTGLKAYFEALGEKAGCTALSSEYRGIKEIVEFAKNVNVKMSLPISTVSCYHNPQWNYLSSGSGRTGNYTNEDFCVEHLERLIKSPSRELSCLIWKTMCKIDESFLIAKYKISDRSGFKFGKSQLVHILSNGKWVPQTNNTFVRPCDALRELLPTGFPYDHGQKWLKDIEFGKSGDEKSKSKNRFFQLAKDFGVKLEHIEFAKSHPDRIDQFIAEETSRNIRPTFPTMPVADPARRQERLDSQLSEAHDKAYENRGRSIRTTRGTIDPEKLLQEWYTNKNGIMVCQICKLEMPFRKRNKEYYFESIEILSKTLLTKEMEVQFLALCPLCAAKYEEFIKYDDHVMEKLRDAIVKSNCCEVDLLLGDEQATIGFVEKHFHDLKIILGD